MCGRYSLTTAPEALRQLFRFDNLPNLAPRFNVAPTQLAPVVRNTESGRELAQLRWGLIPSWAKDPSIGSKMINARAETVAEKPSFRSAFRHRRCLIPSDGFYEWRREGALKQPFRIGMRDGAPFAMAGLWESWDAPDGGTLESFTIITTSANAKLRPIHARMPALIPVDAYDSWLSGEAGTESLGPANPEPMAFYRVTTRVNSVRNDDEECIAPLAK